MPQTIYSILCGTTDISHVKRMFIIFSLVLRRGQRRRQQRNGRMVPWVGVLINQGILALRLIYLGSDSFYYACCVGHIKHTCTSSLLSFKQFAATTNYFFPLLQPLNFVLRPTLPDILCLKLQFWSCQRPSFPDYHAEYLKGLQCAPAPP